jgi:HK97 family phage prohead protease
MPKKYDFAGWATKNDIKCSDGRTIRHGAFSADNGKRVPLVWNHRHDDVTEVLGHALLEERPEGMYAYCSFNGTERGQAAKETVQHGDIVALSIYANQLKQKAGDVIHGAIKEVSLVLAGANRGALIDSVMEHGEESDDEAEIQFVGYGDIEFYHADDEGEEMAEDKKTPAEEGGEKTVQDVYDTLTDEQKKVVAFLVGKAVEDATSGNSEVKHADDDQNDEEEDGDDDKTVQDVYDTMNDEQKKVVAFLVGKAIEDNEDSNEGGTDMKHSVFASEEQNNVLSHAEFQEIFAVGKQMGSLAAAFEAAENDGYIEHADGDYGVGNIEYLFPDAKAINNTPEFIKRETTWVDKVLNACHRTPFSRIKSIFANITEDEARAKGYIKGKLKKEEVFTLLKRTTDPQTIYKKQKLDKDDIDDITDMNVVAWVKAEMQLMLREEIARAILIGDGRLASSDDKIQESHIRPVYNDADLYTVKVAVEVAANASAGDVADALITAMIKSRKFYKGSGNPTFYTTDDYLTDALLLKNGINERLYKSEAEVATAMRVKEVVPVEVMEGQQIAITEEGVTTNYPLMGVSVNLVDYNIGTNGGAKTDFFDDFDIDFNQYKYLYETRMSGALIKPFSAISFYLKRATN